MSEDGLFDGEIEERGDVIETIDFIRSICRVRYWYFSIRCVFKVNSIVYNIVISIYFSYNS